MKYIRLCEGFNKAKLIKNTDNIYAHIADTTKEWYYSTYLFNDKHKQLFDKNHSVKGIRDVTTNSLWWDIDIKGNLDAAKDTTLEIVDKLINLGIPENGIQVRFSGGKGFHIWIDTTEEFTPTEVQNIATSIAGDLPGFDTTLYDATQVIRVPLTKHTSGLFCRPIKVESLRENSMDDIVDSAKDISSLSIDNIKNYYQKVPLSKAILDLKNVEQKKEVEKVQTVEFDIKQIDFTKKPTFLDNASWALQLGYFRGSEAASKTGDVGERSHALLCLASIYKKKGFDKLSTYHLLKGVAESQSLRTGEEKFSNERLWETIIGQVYSEGWNGGKHRVWLEEQYIPRYAIPQIEYNINARIVTAKDGFKNFLEYAKKIDEYRFEFGIKELDDKMKAKTGYVIGMLAPPGIGKTSFAITAINNTSTAGKRSIVFSYDMAESVLFQKLIQRETGNNEDYIFNIVKRAVSDDKKAQYLIKQWGELIDNNYKNVNFVFKSGQTLPEIKQTIMETELALGESIPFIIIDYSELVLSQFSDPTQASAEVIQGLREIANEMNKCVLVLLQPNKMSSTPNQPLLDYNCAKGSSAIAQAVTMMITAHRPGYSSTDPENDRFFSINCVKNRMGALFAVDFGWDGPTGKITEIAPSERTFLNQLREANNPDSEPQSGTKYIKDF